MAAIATQFIGIPANLDMPTSTRTYQQNWDKYGLANTGHYTPDDLVMVSGNTPRTNRYGMITAAQIRETFAEHYQPLLEKAIAAKSQFLVGNAKGTDQLLQKYLLANGYQLSETDKGYFKCTPQLEKNPLNPSQVLHQAIAECYQKTRTPKIRMTENWTAFVNCETSDCFVRDKQRKIVFHSNLNTGQIHQPLSDSQGVAFLDCILKESTLPNQTPVLPQKLRQKSPQL
jgi:hypothetical protein